MAWKRKIPSSFQCIYFCYRISMISFAFPLLLSKNVAFSTNFQALLYLCFNDRTTWSNFLFCFIIRYAEQNRINLPSRWKEECLSHFIGLIPCPTRVFAVSCFEIARMKNRFFRCVQHTMWNHNVDMLKNDAEIKQKLNFTISAYYMLPNMVDERGTNYYFYK